jgi:peptidoglycan/LPS O-acetylase OafA/YrhL
MASAYDKFYLPELDALRFLAFLAVFSCHSWDFRHGTNQLVDIGTFGVDLFFTLSAFLITELLVREKEQFGAVDVPAFYIRRILRIWPLYFAFRAAAFLTASRWSAPRASWLYFASCAGFIGNFGFYWLGPASPVIGSLWSISVEEQFYLSWPIVLRKLTQRGVIFAGALIWAFSICSRWLLVRDGAGSLIEFGTIGRLDPIACGILLSAFRRSGAWRNPSNAVRLALLPAGLWLWLIADVLAAKGLMVPVYLVVAMGCAAFMVAIIGFEGWARNEWLCYLGKISYGLYVLHAAVTILVISAFGGNHQSWIIPPVALVLTILLTAASYHWVETPFLKMKARFQKIRSGSLGENPVPVIIARHVVQRRDQAVPTTIRRDEVFRGT